MLLLADSAKLSQKQLDKIMELEGLVMGGTPPQYIFKKAYFCGLRFYIDENVLIPRPETELLVEQATQNLESRIKNQGKKVIRILDLGTGSGCIAITIKKLFPSVKVTAVDCSGKALDIAKRNAKSHKTKISFIQSNLFEKVEEGYDLILANLPYGDPDDPDYKKVADPARATNGGKEGFELIEKAIKKLQEHLRPTGQAIFEIGYNQKKLIQKTAKVNYLKVKVLKDLNDFDRIATVSLDRDKGQNPCLTDRAS
jgi:release factor glutamine methyltransferase